MRCLCCGNPQHSGECPAITILPPDYPLSGAIWYSGRTYEEECAYFDALNEEWMGEYVAPTQEVA